MGLYVGSGYDELGVWRSLLYFGQASDFAFGAMKVGDGLSASAGVLSATRIATTTQLGLVKPDNTTLELAWFDSAEKLNVISASKTKKGIVKVPSSTPRSIDIVAGVMSANPATTSFVGAVKPATSNFTVAGDGAMTLASSNPLLSSTTNSVVNSRYSLSLQAAGTFSGSATVYPLKNTIRISVMSGALTLNIQENTVPIPAGGVEIFFYMDTSNGPCSISSISVNASPVKWENGSMPSLTSSSHHHIRILPYSDGFLAYQVN
jgi:hypothetical protein